MTRYLKTLGLTSILWLTVPSVKSQTMTVPYRVGDQFGISDAKGKMLIPPQYDWVEVDDPDDAFLIGFTLRDGKPRSSLIDKGRIVLRDQDYQAYYRYGQFFKAYEYRKAESTGRRRNDHYSELTSLFTKDGKALLVGFDDVFVYLEMDRADRMNEVLIYARDTGGKHSLRLYNKGLKKIRKIFFDSSDHFELVRNYEGQNREDTSMQFFYRDRQGKGRRLHIGRAGKTLKVLAQGPADLKKEEREEWGTDIGMADVALVPSPPDTRALAPGDSISLRMRSVSINRRKYYLPRQIEEVQIGTVRLDPDGNVVVIRDKKQGLQAHGADTLIIPARYDEIMGGDFAGQNGGYILRDGAKYGLYIYDWPLNMVVEPMYDQLPLLMALDYFGKHSPLVKLYDSAGKFFCYADGAGKLFYSPR